MPTQRDDTTSTPQLTYKLDGDPPAPFRTGYQKQNLTITVSNPKNDTLICDHLVFTLATGDTDDALVPDNTVQDIEIAHPSGWANETPRTKTFTMTPDRKAKKIPDRAKFLFTLSRITVSGKSGKGCIDICETMDDSPQVCEPHYIVKMSTGFILTDFKPDRLAVPAGTTVTVSWTVEGRVDEQLTLYWTGSPTTDKDVTNDHSHAIQCTRDTAFELVAKKGDLTFTLYTFVTVTNPYLQVRDLKVLNRASLLTTLKAGTQDPLTPKPVTMKNPVTHTYTANTDGFLIGALQTFPKTATAELTITIKPPTGTTHTSITRVTGNHDDVYDPGTPIAVPVPTDSTVTITWNLQDPTPPPPGNQQIQAFAPTLRWQPLGTGELHPHTP